MDPSSSPAPEPGEHLPHTARRLDRSPGERYRAGPDPEPEAPGERGLPPLAVAVGVGVAAAGLTILLGGILSLSSGLLIVAGGSGWLIGRALAASAGSRNRNRAGAVAMAALAVVAGQIGLWLFAMSQGGALSLPDYITQTWGLLAPVQLVVATVAAWLASR